MALCTDPRMVHRETVAEVSICVYVSRVRVYNRAPPPPPPQLGDSARRRRWEERETWRGRRLGGVEVVGKLARRCQPNGGSN